MTPPAELQEQLSEVADITVLPGARLADHTRFRLGGPCWFLVDAASEEAFTTAYRLLETSKMPWASIGAGTNLVVSDAGYEGAILRYSAAGIEAAGRSLRAEAGADLNAVIDVANAHGLAGMEAMAGIPGWLGAAIYGNAGAYGQSIHQRVRTVRFFDGTEVREFGNAECQFRYRHSGFKNERRWQILSAQLDYEAGDAVSLKRRSAEIRALRDAKFPPTMRCAGSIFKNLLLKDLPAQAAGAVPSSKVIEGKVPAGWFLEEVGAKGFRVGGIRVADYHANLVYNDGRGTTQELVQLLTELKARVRQRFGLQLEEEVQYLGFPANGCARK